MWSFKLFIATRLIALTGLVLSPATAQSTGVMTLFLPDSEPLSLEALVVAVNTIGTARGTPVTTMQVACPTAPSPDNDGCRSAGIYPAQVYHTQGSVWGGTTTYTADDSTTTWICSLGGSPPEGAGTCTKTIVGGGSTRTETTEYDGCYVAAHQRPIVVTEGASKVPVGNFGSFDASQYLSMRGVVMSEAGCPASQTTIWAGAVASTTAGADSADTVGTTAATADLNGASPATTAPTTQTQTDPAPAATTTPNGAARGGSNPATALLVGSVAIMMVAAMV